MIETKVIDFGLRNLRKIPLLAEHSVQKAIITSLMEGARARMIQKAGSMLGSTRMDYIQGIQELEDKEHGVSLSLLGSLPNMVEHGWEGGFLHETLLGDNSSGWKTSADGNRYRSIPFRHKTPGTGSQGGQPMGSQFVSSREASDSYAAIRAQAIGKKIHQKARRMITQAEKQAGRKGKTRMGAGFAPKLKDHHATDIFAGMQVQKQKVTGKKGGVSEQRTYTTFRTISEANPASWHHPGIEAKELFTEVGKYVEDNAQAAVEAVLMEIMK